MQQNKPVETQYPVDVERLLAMKTDEVENYFVNELKAFENTKSFRLFLTEMVLKAEADGDWDFPIIYLSGDEKLNRPMVEEHTASVNNASITSVYSPTGEQLASGVEVSDGGEPFVQQTFEDYQANLVDRNDAYQEMKEEVAADAVNNPIQEEN